MQGSATSAEPGRLEKEAPLDAPPRMPIPPDEKLFTISELTREFQITTRTIRYYEGEGMLEPFRRGRQRLFSQRQRTRLKLILRGRRLGLSLAGIREIIDMYDADPGEAGQVRLLISKIAHRRAELEQKRQDIDVTLAELDEVERNCRARLGDLQEHTP